MYDDRAGVSPNLEAACCVFVAGAALVCVFLAGLWSGQSLTEQNAIIHDAARRVEGRFEWRSYNAEKEEKEMQDRRRRVKDRTIRGQ